MSSFLHKAVSRMPPGVLRWIGRAQFRNRAIRALVARGSSKLTESEVEIRFGAGAGLRMKSGRSNPGYALGTTEPDVQEFIAEALSPGQVFYDIGANVGFFTLIGARNVGPEGRVYAFEPVGEVAAALRHNVEINSLNHVEVLEMAISAESGVATLALGSSTQDGRLVSGAEGQAGVIEVQVGSLDSLVDEGRVRPADFVKIDAEGAEFDVLRGMRRLLVEHTPTVVCEVHGGGRPIDSIRTFGEALAGVLGDSTLEVSENGRPRATIAGAASYELWLLEDAASDDDELWTPHVVARPL
jgi:FkbM family methyltransferase